MPQPTVSDAERFWANVIKTDTCWLWNGGMSTGGYGCFVAQGRTRRVHRYSYELHKGAIPAGLYLDHLCHSQDPTCEGGDTCPHRRCINPDHLEPVTPWENSLRGNATAAINAAKTHCPQGHEYTPENTYLIKPTQKQRHGARACRACRREAAARWSSKRRQNPAT